jgi:hypothetical protein
MNDYTPNFNDPRVIKRVKTALGFTNAMLKDTPKRMSCRFIDKHFGMSSHKLSRYLRDNLIICVNNNYNKDTGVCKSYVANNSGRVYLNEMIGNDINSTMHSATQVDSAIEWAQNTYADELESLNFTYKDKSHRLCNPIQNIRSDVRAELLAKQGLSYNYDISAAAPTLLYQYSLRCGGATGEVLEHIESYIADKDVLRNKLALSTDLSTKVIKQLINALFAGAALSGHPQRALFKLIGCDTAKMVFLQQHEDLTALRNDIKHMWSIIKVDANVRYYSDKFNKDGSNRKIRFGPKDKWNIYFQLERRVLNEIRSYLSVVGSKCFLEHDGFRTTQKIDTIDLQHWIAGGTGYNVLIVEKCYTKQHTIEYNITNSNQSKKVYTNTNQLILNTKRNTTQTKRVTETLSKEQAHTGVTI